MTSSRKRPLLLAAIFFVVLAVSAIAQGAKFPGGYFTANNGDNDIGLDFDSTGVINVYVDNQAFSKGTWDAKADTMNFGAVEGPEGYGCPGSARYLWALAENKLSFSLLADDCQVRSQALTALVWTKK